MGSAAQKTRSGELINEVYELHELLESGKLCDTYRATDTRQSRVVKLKLLRPELALQSGAVQRFLHSPKTLFGKSHPNLSAVFAVDSDDTGIPFVVEEHVEGEPLARTIERFPKGMPLPAAQSLIAPLVEALAFTHERGLVHGRLDRNQVIVTAVGGNSVPKLAAPAAPDKVSAVAPDVRGDVRALGALLYELLSGRAPAKPHVALAVRVPKLPPALSAVVDRCLGDGAATAADVRAALASLNAPSPAEQRSQLAFAKTMLADSPSATAVILPPDEASFDDEPEVSLQAAADADEPEISFAAVATEPAPAPAVTVVDPPLASESTKPARVRPTRADRRGAQRSGPAPAAADGPVMVTMSDVAAAFGPIEGAERVGQAEVEAAAEEPAAVERRVPRGSREPSPARKPPPSRKQQREGGGDQPRGLSPEQLRAIRERAQETDRSYGRMLSALLFLLFAFLLVFAIPLLTDARKAHALFGPYVRVAVAGFALLSVFALVRTWAQQIQTRPIMLRPVTLTLKVVVAAIWALGAGFFLPAGALGTVASGARHALAWGGAGFFLFLGIFGLMQQVREAANNSVRSMLMALLYVTSFMGAYRVVDTGILGGFSRSRGVLGVANVRADMHSLTQAAQGELTASDAGQAEEVHERVEVGASEVDDMRAIEEMNDSRRRRSSALDKMGTHMKDQLK